MAVSETAIIHKLSRIYNQQNDIYMKMVKSGWCHNHAYDVCYKQWLKSIDRLKIRVAKYESD